MLEQVSTTVKFLAFYTASKQGKTGLTVTIDIYDPSGSQIVTDGSASALGGGLYYYELSSSNSTTGEYAAIFKTTDTTVDAQHIPSLWVLGRAGVEHLDAAVTSRLADADYTAPANSDITDIKAKTDNLPASPAAVSDIPTSDITAIKAKTDTIPASPAAVSDIPTASENATAVRTELTTELAHLDADVSSRATSADIPSSDISAIKTKTDALETTRLAQCSTVATTGAQLAAALS